MASGKRQKKSGREKVYTILKPPKDGNEYEFFGLYSSITAVERSIKNLVKASKGLYTEFDYEIWTRYA